MNLFKNIFEPDFVDAYKLLEDICSVDDSDDIIHISFIDWISGVSFMCDELHNIFGTSFGIDSDYIMHITHDLFDKSIIKIKDVLDQLMFRRLNRSSFL